MLVLAEQLVGHKERHTSWKPEGKSKEVLHWHNLPICTLIAVAIAGLLPRFRTHNLVRYPPAPHPAVMTAAHEQAQDFPNEETAIGQGAYLGGYGGYDDDGIIKPPPKSPRDAWRSNVLLIGLTLLAPWLLFIIIFAVMSFSVRYSNPGISWFIFSLGVIMIIGAGAWAVATLLRRTKEPYWQCSLFVLLILALVVSTVVGHLNFQHNLQPYHDSLRLNSYDKVDPMKYEGNQVMDAGLISFLPDYTPDFKHAMAFRNHDLYCVTPIIKKGFSLVERGSYDFWAVGKNCCSGNAGDFHCGEFNNPKAHAGLRIVSQYQVPFYRLAVQMAEAAYNIKATHPILLEWLEDPMDELAAAAQLGMRYYNIGVWSYLAGQAIVVCALTVVFAKISSD